MALKRYLSLYTALWKNSVTREMSFKGNFILWIVVELLWFGLQLSFVTVVYSQTESVGTWSKWQMVLLVGASNFIQQLYQAFFLTNCTNLSELVRTGELPKILMLYVPDARSSVDEVSTGRDQSRAASDEILASPSNRVSGLRHKVVLSSASCLSW